MKDYSELFVRDSLLMSSSSDRNERKSLRIHNQAMTRVWKLSLEMYREPDRCAQIALQLLDHESEKVRVNIACYCLRAQIHQDQARQVLNYIIQNSTDRMMAVTADGTIRYTKTFEEQGL